jgi:hypothetical protein
MTVEVHVEGQIALGRMPEFAETIEQYKDYAKNHQYAVPRVLIGLSGAMNSVRLVYSFPDASGYEEQELRTLRDTEYGQVAGSLGFVDGTLVYSIYREV